MLPSISLLNKNYIILLSRVCNNWDYCDLQIDKAIAEEELGEVEVFDSFDEFKAAMARWADSFVLQRKVKKKNFK